MKKTIIIITCIGMLLACAAPIVFTREWSNIKFDQTTGPIGDTIGGTTAPIIGILSIVLLCLTLTEQISFNKKQQEIASDEQFKSTFFSLLQVQRDIIEKISGKFSYLGLFTYEEYPQDKEKIKILRKDKEWLTIQNKSNNEVCGFEFFKQVKYQLKLIYEALDSETFYNNYDVQEAYEAEDQLRREIITGCNIPPEIEEKQNKLINDTRLPYRLAYVNDKYSITKKMHILYHTLPEEKKVGMGYAVFFNKYEGVGYYFRHLYRILKFIKMNEDEKIKSYGKNISAKEKLLIRNHFKQYAQFIQAQMSIEELLILFYNSFMFEKAQRLIIYYDLLENLTVQNLIREEHNCNSKIKMKNKRNLFTEMIKA